MESKERAKFLALAEIYNGAIDTAAELLIRKVAVFNQLNYLSVIEGAAPERVAYLESAKRRYSVALSEFDLVPIPTGEEERAYYCRQRESLQGKLSLINENLAGFEKLPHEVQKRRYSLAAELLEINSELVAAGGILKDVGTQLDKNLSGRTFKGRGFESGDSKITEILRDGIKRYKVKEEMFFEEESEA